MVDKIYCDAQIHQVTAANKRELLNPNPPPNRCLRDIYKDTVLQLTFESNTK